MSCPHGNGPPDRCSICIGAKPRLVDQVGGDITIDGEVARPIAPPMTDAQIKYSQRGGTRRKPK